MFVQADVDYRREWDSLIIKLDIIERDPHTGSEVVQWIMKFPVSTSNTTKHPQHV
jgi:hypothetical protein